MRVLVDALGLPVQGGARSSSLGWIAGTAQVSPNNRYFVVVSRHEKFLDRCVNIEQIVAPAWGERLGVRLWAQLNLPRLVRKLSVDLVHFTKNHGLLSVPCPAILTINDLTRLFYPAMFSSIDVLYWKTVQHRVFRTCNRIVAISQNTKRDLIRYYSLPPDFVKVIYPAVDACFKDLPTLDDESEMEVLRRYGIDQPYVLSVGGLAAHKNLYAVLRAFVNLVESGELLNTQFVVVGARIHSHTDARLQKLSSAEYRDRVHFTGIVEAGDLPIVYRRAKLFVYPSLYEGFGLAPLEAMSCGTPTLVSRVASLPEVVGAAGEYFSDPESISAVAQDLLRLLHDPRRLEFSGRNGLARSGQFSWTQTGEQTLRLYEEVLGEQK